MNIRESRAEDLCPSCKGSGRELKAKPAWPKTKTASRECWVCRGTGRKPRAAVA